jgi:hypothetical protein
MREIRTSGLMSGAGNRGGGIRQYPRPASTLPPTQGIAQTHHRRQLFSGKTGIIGIRSMASLSRRTAIALTHAHPRAYSHSVAVPYIF